MHGEDPMEGGATAIAGIAGEHTRSGIVEAYCTLNPDQSQRKKRIAAAGPRVYTAGMAEASEVSRRLKLLRRRAGLTIREVAQALGMEHGSSYQHYEDRFRKAFLPLELVMKLVPIFREG